MIRIENLYKSFRKNHVLQGVSLEFGPGNITAILGPNGSGKTTMIKCLLGMVIPDQGDMYIDDVCVNGKYAYRKDVAYLPQIARFPENLTVRELFRMIEDIRGKASRRDGLIERFSLHPYMNMKLAALSGGTKQKVNIVQALMFDSPILILDEPTSGLDPIAMLELKSLIRMEQARGKTILVTSHIMHFVDEMAEQLVFLLDGNVYFNGTVAALKDRYHEQNLEAAIAGLLSGEKWQLVPGNGRNVSILTKQLQN